MAMFAEVSGPVGMLAGLLVLVILWCLFRLRRVDGNILKTSATLAGIALALALCGQAAQVLDVASAHRVLTDLAILVAGITAIRILGITLCRVTLPGFSLNPPRIIEDLLILLAYVAWGLVQLHAAGMELSGIVTTSAVITGIVAFSMQETLGNILGGVALQVDNSIHIGDWVDLDGARGRVIEIHWRHTAVRNNDGEVIIIPNSLLMKSRMRIYSSARVTQWRQTILFTVDQHIPPQDVIAVVEQALGDSEIAGVSKSPLPNCILKRFEQGLAHYALRYWLTDTAQDEPVNSNVLVHIYAALQRRGYPLGRPGFDALVTSDSGEREARLRDLDIDRRLKALNKIELFSVLSLSERTQLAANLTEAMFVEGDLITRQGAEAHSLYILVKGEVDVWFEPDQPGKPRHHVTSLKPGQIFGEMGLMTGEQRSATVTAKTHAECFRLGKSSFESILHARPEIAHAIGGILSERSLRMGIADAGAAHSHPHADNIVGAIRRFFGLQA
jgi:small-conductance mechanosensitive channel